ncbi:MAG: AEC family transporter [Dehalococcoidia bacterium]
MLEVFLDVVLPVALVAIAGGLVGRWQDVPVAPISVLVFYLFSPALVFHSLATTEVSGAVSIRIVGVLAATYVATYAVATGWSVLARHDQAFRAGFALTVITPNLGNMGLPVALLAFGQPGLDIAVMNFVAGAVLTYTVGIFVASMASGTRVDAFRAPFRYPVLYAAAAGIALNIFGIELPTTIDAPAESLAAAAVPAMLVVLGLQLRQAAGLDHLLDTAMVVATRFLVAPTAAWAAGTALGLRGDTRGTLVVLAAMPTAVVATILATEFRAAPVFVTRAVVATTLASMLTLTVLISLVR